jgi:hypothetical protein
MVVVSLLGSILWVVALPDLQDSLETATDDRRINTCRKSLLISVVSIG